MTYKFLVLFFAALSLQARAQKNFEAQPLDELMLKTCSAISASSSCQTRMSEVRLGMNPSKFISNAPKLEIDSKIETIVVNSPAKMIADYYCLARFNELIPSFDFEPDVFAYAVNGFSFSKDSEKPYTKWLSSSASKDCREQLSKIGLEPTRLKTDKSYRIVLNPVTFFESGADEDFYAAANTIYNHERLHALFAQEKAEAKISKFWKKLSNGQQEQFQLEHPSYNFKNKKILAREFFSYTFEKDPTKAYDFLKGKYDKITFEDLQNQLCSFCVNQDAKALETAKSLAQLGPKELLAHIEKEGIKILILSSGRKNPSPLFNWGQIRIDKGELTQITKLEGAMGKTLCRGEKPESREGTTIVLAADSPYSTLIHEYLHVLQLQRDSSWCPVSRQLWGRQKVSPREQRMVRDREWDVRLVLWNLLEAPPMTVEDRLMVTDGLLNEASERKAYDPSAVAFVDKNDLKTKRSKEIKEYMEKLKPN
jgi:hypothetical protein